MNRPFLLYVLLALLLFLGMGGFIGGGMLLLQPDGSLLGMSIDWLAHSPFSTYVIPGLILFIFNGLFVLLTVVGLLLKPDWQWTNAINLYHNQHWAWAYSLYSGIIVITWITIQLLMTHYFWLQPVMILTGLCIIICTMTPTIMKHFAK